MTSLPAMSTPAQIGTSTPLSERREKAVATTIERGDTLLTDGYKIDPHPSLRPGLYIVTKPSPTLDKATGELVESYEVDTTAGPHGSCQCKMFEFAPDDKKTCKHLRATLKHIAHCYNFLAPMLAQSGLGVPGVEKAATAPTRALSCPHCGHGSTIAAQDLGQHICLKCLRFFDEVQSPNFGGMEARTR